ncbi:mannosyltransferase family protein [Kribbella sp. ALI-6-A]|uniref:mannosyltransferase family protein n=1 Tax=Kribbella sp. ALI-6-A TaxID=1933817 RepID=UPI00192D00EC|nr:mannosyltransferase family protein [Kribbella sp. ALI-6-A]
MHTTRTEPLRSADTTGLRRVFAPAVWRDWLSPADWRVLYLYLLTRLAVGMTAYCALWLFPGNPETREPAKFGTAFQRWDWYHFVAIARVGYFPGSSGPWTDKWDNREAFFPGFPLVLRAVHTVVPHWTLSGLLISFVSGGVAVVALARIGRAYRPGTSVDQDAVLFFLLSPCAIFLAVGYSEALFLAFALPAWLAARRHSWALAAILAAFATSVRITGLFLAVAVAVHFVVTVRAHRRWRAVPWLAVPALPVIGYFCYLHAQTGDWMAWKHAQERGWYRTFTVPWDSWATTWESAFGHLQTTGYGIMFQAELVAMVIGLVLLGLLLRRRHWGEAAYVGVSLLALGTSYWYMSIPRATLLWWPLWIGLALWAQGRPRFRTAYLCLAVPLSTVVALTFLTGRWAG